MSLLLSVVIITKNEEANLPRTLESVKPLVENGQGEIIVVDSGSTYKTVEIAKSYGAKVFVEEWKGFAAQKNSALEKAAGEWVLSLDADEAISEELATNVLSLLRAGGAKPPSVVLELTVLMLGALFGGSVFLSKRNRVDGYYLPRKNLFLGRWVKHGGYWPDRKLRLFRRSKGHFMERRVHETARVDGPTAAIRGLFFRGALLHDAYPTLEIYLEHMRRYADLGAEVVKDKPRWWLWLNRWLNPPLTFFYNYVVRLGFLDGREGYLLHRNHARYVGWKYAKALELKGKTTADQRG